MTRQLIAVVSMALFVMFTATSAQARHHKHHSHIHRTQVVTVTPYAHCDDRYPASCGQIQTIKQDRRIRMASSGDGVIGGRPSGCPHAFCGCEASLYLFGAIRSDLNLASNWARKFPRASPAPRMAAVRNHHVMVLMSHVEGSNWLVHDGNSGGGKTREHIRSISGYAIVDPNGNRMASR